jgi:NADPH:quinone reductase-like Zn-dependent oxidoreductase
MTQAAIVSVFIKKQGRPFYSPVRRQDLLDLTEMINAGRLRAVIDRSYTLAETPAAMEYIATGHASGKTVIEI